MIYLKLFWTIFPRSLSDVPIKVQEFVITLSDTKLLHKVFAQHWAELESCDIKLENCGVNKNNVIGDIMIQPKKLYKISFHSRHQFDENSELRVSIKIFFALFRIYKFYIRLGTVKHFWKKVITFEIRKVRINQLNFQI